MATIFIGAISIATYREFSCLFLTHGLAQTRPIGMLGCLQIAQFNLLLSDFLFQSHHVFEQYLGRARQL